jgi:large subunit ribosomal protein L29
MEVRMEAKEIREMAEADISARIAELEEERFRLRFRSATEPLDQPLRLRVIRKDIARLRTVLREKTANAPANAAGGGTRRGAGSQKAGT